MFEVGELHSEFLLGVLIPRIEQQADFCVVCLNQLLFFHTRNLEWDRRQQVAPTIASVGNKDLHGELIE